MGMNTFENEDNMWRAWQESAPRLYEKTYYGGNTIVGRVNNAGHRIVEQWFSQEDHISSVLEVGAGTGYHLSFVRHRFDSYVMTDLSPGLLRLAQEKNGDSSNLSYEVQDATKLGYDSGTFDRLISIYNLEHLLEPHKVMKEWKRVLRPGGILSIAIPLDGGIAWRLGRYLTTRRSFAREGLDLDYIIAREHINPSYNLISLIRHYFDDRHEQWYPMKIPSVDVNLVYCCNLRSMS
jgi:SAM-dependent methyltransferase